MADRTKLEHLDRFGGLTDADVKKIVEHGTHLTVPSGWALVAEQTPADKAYLLLAGEVSVRHHGEEIARLGPGDIMGEVGIIEHRLRNATLIALTQLEVLHFTREAVEELIDQIPEFKRALEETAAQRKG